MFKILMWIHKIFVDFCNSDVAVYNFQDFQDCDVDAQNLQDFRKSDVDS